MQNSFTITGNLVDILNKKIYAAEVVVENKIIKSPIPNS
jgi:adenine deaminase